MRIFWQDVRFGLRMLAKSPGFTIVAVLTLALGIGANTAVFSVVNGFMLRPLPGKNNEHVVKLGIRHPGSEDPHGLSYLDFRDYRAQCDLCSDLAAFGISFVGMNADNRSERLIINYVSGNLFSMLGQQPAAGRLFHPGEGDTPGTEPNLVLTYTFWQKRFGGDPAVVGKSVNINRKSYIIVGIAPKGFVGPYIPLEVDAFIPVGMANQTSFTSNQLTNRSEHNFQVIGKLKPGVTLAQVRSSLQVIAQRLAREYPATNKDISVDVFPEPLARPEPSAAGGTPLVAGVFLGMVGLVLVVTCINVANLLLVRASARFKEMAIRSSLGAGRIRIFRQALTESLLLSIFGGAAGAAVGWGLSNLIAAVRDLGPLPLHFDFSFDWRVFAYIGVAVVFCGIVAGLGPAWHASRMNLNSILREGGRSQAGGGHHRMRNVLVVAQVAGSLVVLIAAGLFVRSLQAAQNMDLGFNPHGVLNLAMDTNQLAYDEARGTTFYREVKDRVKTMPGVESAAFVVSVPMGYNNQGARVWKEGQAGVPETQLLNTGFNKVTEDYFRTMQIPILRGRPIGEEDQKNSTRVAVINETMASRLWPGEDPIGHHFSFTKSDAPPVEVVGVAKNGKYQWIAEDPSSFFYVPLSQNYASARTLQVRTQVPPKSLTDGIERQIHALDADLPIYDVDTMEESLGGGNGFFLLRMAALMAGSLGLLGLVLAVVGVYGVVAYSVGQRTHEIGIRMAIGAEPPDILRMIVGQGLGLVGIGLGIGLAMSVGFTRLVGNLLLQVGAMDPLTFVLVSLLLTGVALGACYIPARRATRVDPLVALRYE